MNHSHKIFIVNNKAKGVFDSVAWHLDNGAELVDSQSPDENVVYILRRATPTYSIKGIKGQDENTYIGFEVTEKSSDGLSWKFNEFVFEDEATQYIADCKASIWAYPYEEKVADIPAPEVEHTNLTKRLHSLINDIDSWKYEDLNDVESIGADQEYARGLNNGLKYAIEEIYKKFPALPAHE